jgi:predicted membrane protein
MVEEEKEGGEAGGVMNCVMVWIFFCFVYFFFVLIFLFFLFFFCVLRSDSDAAVPAAVAEA